MSDLKRLADECGLPPQLFDECRGIMGTTDTGQDSALARAIAHANKAVGHAADLGPGGAAMLREIREHAEATRDLVNRVQQFVEDRSREPLPEGHAPHSQVTHPGRWAALAQTELQSGFMKLARALQQPPTF